jgi:hypothetical protein
MRSGTRRRGISPNKPRPADMPINLDEAASADDRHPLTA